MVQVIPSVFTKPGSFGDFLWMLNQPEYEDSLFIFNDNEDNHRSTKRGGGNAVIRPFNKYNSSLPRPRSAGIPTGLSSSSGGYLSLNAQNQNVINGCVDEIKELIIKYEYKRVYYSADESGNLGTSIFVVSEDVVRYITNQIKSLEDI